MSEVLSGARRLLTDAEAAGLVGMSERWIWRETSAGRFPQPIRLGRSARWDRDELHRWVNERLNARPERRGE